MVSRSNDPRFERRFNSVRFVGLISSVIVVGLPAFRSVEENPCREIFTKVFKTVYRHCRHKKEVSGGEGKAFFTADKVSVARQNYIDLIPVVRILVISADWLIDLDVQSSVVEHFAKPGFRTR